MSFNQRRADRINEYFRALRHVDRFLAIHAALVVLAIGDQNDGPAHRATGGLFHQFVATGEIDRVPQRGSAASLDHSYAGAELIYVPGKILRYVPGFVKGQHKSTVRLGTDDFKQKL